MGMSKRADFGCFIHHGADTAAIDWEGAISALDGGGLPSSGGERRMLRLAASLADRASVSLGEAITGIDDRNVGLLVTAIHPPPDAASWDSSTAPWRDRDIAERSGHGPVGRTRDS
jgi:hypothetical protein